MSMYSLLFGQNPQTDLLLAVLGLRQTDIERFRDVFASDDGATISVYTRTGGSNRSDYPNSTMRHLPTWRGSVDDDFDTTYCTDSFAVPEKWQRDVQKLGDILGNGIRRQFGNHLLKTLRREPTEVDQNHAAYESERAALSRTSHQVANGHTFVPIDDDAMLKALELAEANGGKLRSLWGIMPLSLDVRTNFYRYPNATANDDRQCLTRADVKYSLKWVIDVEYWEHCKQRFMERFPLAMANIATDVERHLERKR